MPWNENKLIKQRRSNDCGIAALAMLFHCSYPAARKLVLESCRIRNESFDGTTVHHAKLVAEAFGQGLRWVRVKPGEATSVAGTLKGQPAVIVVPANDGSADHHALYWDGYWIYDPAYPLKPYGRRGTKALKTMTEVWIPHNL